ncbi:unnamed protein product [Symbiodinium natans]|uniref:Uncharacterized protein n=1 Tax=Symbiodinium natans TaxID=878477 RepID=A0A812KHY6_9DINO|nr:unnamed protein product [Symbiodinium natans]
MAGCETKCVVQTGGCSMSAKVKLCVVSGAAGVLIMEAPNAADNPSLPVPDEQGQVYLSEGESLADLVPVLFTSYNDQLWTALMHEEAASAESWLGGNEGTRSCDAL